MKQDSKLLSIQELADKLGMSVAQMKRKKDYVLKKYPEFKATMEGYFTTNGGAKYFCAEHFDEFASMMNTIKKYKPRAKQAKIVDEPKVYSEEEIKTKLAEVLVKDDKTTNFVETVMPEPVTEMTGVIGLEKKLAALLEICKSARAQLNKANDNCRLTLDKAYNCTNPQERGKLLLDVQQANDTVLMWTDAVANADAEFNRADSLLLKAKTAEKEMQAAETAACIAKQKWNETLAEVAELMNEYVSNKR